MNDIYRHSSINIKRKENRFTCLLFNKRLVLQHTFFAKDFAYLYYTCPENTQFIILPTDKI